MSSKELVIILYQSFLRHAKILDKHKQYKAILPHNLTWGANIKMEDLYYSKKSCVEVVKEAFRVVPRKQNDVNTYIDEAIRLNKEIANRIELLHTVKMNSLTTVEEHTSKLVTFKEPAIDITYQEWREKELIRIEHNRNSKALRDAFIKATCLIENARHILEMDLDSEYKLSNTTKARMAKVYYQESIQLYPTADAHTYLGWQSYLDGQLEDAISECKKALAVDPYFGNTYNDLGLISMAQGKDDEAHDYFKQAKQARRNAVRHFPYLNQAALYLKHSRVKAALHEYVQALYWMEKQGDEPTAIRNTVCDMATFLLTYEEELSRQK